MEIPVTNVGKRDGAEVVHWFISDPFSTITRPCKELKHFEKQLIKAGETHIFRFEIDPMRDLGFVNANGEHFLENGEYYVIVKDQKVKFTPSSFHPSKRQMACNFYFRTNKYTVLLKIS